MRYTAIFTCHFNATNCCKVNGDIRAATAAAISSAVGPVDPPTPTTVANAADFVRSTNTPATGTIVAPMFPIIV